MRHGQRLPGQRAGEDGAVRHQQPRPGVVDDAHDLVGGQPGPNGDRHAAGAQHGPLRDDELHPVPGAERDAVAARKAEGGEGARRMRHEPRELGEGYRRAMGSRQTERLLHDERRPPAEGLAQAVGQVRERQGIERVGEGREALGRRHHLQGGGIEVEARHGAVIACAPQAAKEGAGRLDSGTGGEVSRWAPGGRRWISHRRPESSS